MVCNINKWNYPNLPINYIQAVYKTIYIVLSKTKQKITISIDLVFVIKNIFCWWKICEIITKGYWVHTNLLRVII